MELATPNKITKIQQLKQCKHNYVFLWSTDKNLIWQTPSNLLAGEVVSVDKFLLLVTDTIFDEKHDCMIIL
jgi:hypothetical protein